MSRIRLNLAELKKAINWVESNTNEVNVTLDIDDHHLFILVSDKASKEVEITLYSTESHMMPKIKKTENL
jgi:hypothetical protein